MASKRKLLIVFSAIVVVLSAAAGIALTLDYDSPELGRAILDRVGRQAGLDVRADGFRLNLLRGLRLENVDVVSRTPGSSFHATADRLVLAHRLGPLLRGQVMVDEIVFERPTIELVSEAERRATPPAGGAKPRRPPPEPPPPAEDAGGDGLRLNVTRFAIVDGTVVIHEAEAGGEQEAGATEIRGLDLELRDITLAPGAASIAQGLTANGEIRADEVLTPATRAENARGNVRLGDGHLRIEDFELPTASGRIVVGELDADFNTDPYTYALNLRGDPLNTNLILGALEDGGLGPGHLTLDLSGDGSEDGNLAGQGVLTLEAGELPFIPVLASLERLVSGTEIIGARYEPFDVRFRIDGERLEIEPFDIRFGELKLRLGGTLGFGGELALRTSFSAPREGAASLEIPKEIVEILTDAEGRVHLPISIDGTQEDPKVDFDRSGWGDMAEERLKKELKKELGKALGKLLGGKEDGP